MVVELLPEKPIVPEPLTELAAVSVCEPPPKKIEPGAVATKLPELLPPPLNEAVPLETWTAPLLLSTKLRV